MIDQLAEVFDLYQEPVVICRHKKIVYCNAASAIFPEQELLKATRDILPAAETGNGSAKAFLSSVSVDGKSYDAVVSRTADGDVFRFLIDRDIKGDVELLSTVSIAVKNALSVFQMASGYVVGRVENSGDEKLNRYLAMMNHSFYAVSHLTDSISRLGTVIGGNMVLEKSVFDLSALCEELAQSIFGVTVKNGIVSSFTDRCGKLLLCGDREKLEEALLCLLANSMKATQPGGRVLLTLKKAGDRALITVSDNGYGIPPEELADVFRRYQRPQRLDKPESGLGVGLSFVRQVAMCHGGNLILDSRENAGTNVTISIPIRETETTTLRTATVSYHRPENTRILTELADVLDSGCYTAEFLD